MQALEGRRNDGTRSSETLGYDLMYVAVPVASGGTVHGAVRITYPTSTLDQRISGTWWRLAGLSAVALSTIAAMGWLLARGVTRPVQAVRDAALALSGGDLTQRARTDVGAPELRDLARTFNQTAATLEQLLAAQRAFVADASHQLRTPLTALRLRLENLQEEITPVKQRDVALAIAETDRLARIVDGLLTLARSDAQRQEPQEVEVAAVIEDRVALWTPQASSKGVTLDVSGSSGSVLAVAGALEQILDNLISNAVNASPMGGIVRIVTEQTPTSLAVHVIDHGPGLSPDDRARAFDRFWRAPGNRAKGTGLGLAIVAELAAANHGDASLADGPGGGVDASVRLPLAASEESKARRTRPLATVAENLTLR